ncbi:hypothetical protein EC957_004375 [Mortierella hygrophila]|uniref:Uncharacterized protein n=1 Tax=Mortierella hygrophila TaxID=979708 RepID=A0A9P6F2D3_9FUNG|nr:hypothetical protein EC957_004375 [Mortierella hygrophila]
MIKDTGTTKTTNATKSEAVETVKAVKSMGDADDPRITPVLFVGTGGLCIGSRMGGNLKLGGGRITNQHRQACPVLMTNEMRTSQVCIYCYHELRLARARRLINGRIKTIRVHGAVECVINDCESVRCGHTIRGWGDSATVVAGYSN